MTIERPIHIWESKGGWEVRMSDSTEQLAFFPTRQVAIDWCQDFAEELNVTVIFVWDSAFLTLGTPPTETKPRAKKSRSKKDKS